MSSVSALSVAAMSTRPRFEEELKLVWAETNVIRESGRERMVRCIFNCKSFRRFFFRRTILDRQDVTRLLPFYFF